MQIKPVSALGGPLCNARFAMADWRCCWRHPLKVRLKLPGWAAAIQAQEARWAAQQDHRATGTGRSPRTSNAVSFRPRKHAWVATPRPPLPAKRPPHAAPTPTGAETALATLILDNARQHQVDPLLIKAVILAESAGRRRATSPKGAMGLMQLMPDTATRFGVANPYDPVQNIMGGTRYLRWLLDRYDGNVALALAGYNAGEGAGDRHGGIPPYRETHDYVRKVRSTHQLLSQRVARKIAREAW